MGTVQVFLMPHLFPTNPPRIAFPAPDWSGHQYTARKPLRSDSTGK
jgi:hypothetical protein